MASENERRRQILEAAARLLRHYGPVKTTIAEIAREAAVGVGTVYLEFESKDAIIAELSAACHASVLGAMRRAAGASRGRFAERLRAVLDARVEAFYALADAGAHGPDLLHCGCPGVRAAHARFLAEERALIAEILREAARARECRAPDPEATAQVLLRAYASFSPPWLFAETRDEVRRLLPALHDLVLEGLLGRATPRSRS